MFAKNKSMKQTAFLRCFLTQVRVLADWTLNTTETTVLAGIIDSWRGCAHILLQRSAMLGSSTYFYWSVSLAYQVFMFKLKKHLKQSFCYPFFYSFATFFKMFVSSSKSRCCIAALLLASFLHRWVVAFLTEPAHRIANFPNYVVVAFLTV